MASTPRVLFYDIETAPIKAYVWGLGKQVVRHAQLDKDHSRHRIITIQYAWNDGKPAKALHWDLETQDQTKMLEEFEKLANQADILVGKNSDRFDIKHIFAQRMFHNMAGYPEWVSKSDDLEKQMRRYFKLPSQSLDYISSQLGLGGKNEMGFQDWIDIVEKAPKWKEKLKKMIKYGCKDVEDTRTIWNYASKHFKLKSIWRREEVVGLTCRHCHKGDCLRPNGSWRGYKEFRCTRCNTYAGRLSAKADKLI